MSGSSLARRFSSGSAFAPRAAGRAGLLASRCARRSRWGLRAVGCIALLAVVPADASAQRAGGVRPPDPRPAAPQPVPDRRREAAREGRRWRFEASARAEVGYDTNVFHTDSATGDAFTRVGGWAFSETNGTTQRWSGRLEVNRKFYREFSRADELEGFLDLRTSRELGRLVAGAGLSSAFLELRLLDREGNLLPRTTFTSLSHRALGFADLRLAKDLYLGAEGGYRLKNYEETSGLPSLDYREWSAELGLTRYLPARLSLRLQGSWEQRGYRERQAADAAGVLDPSNPDLRLRQVEGEARLRKRWGKRGLLEATFALRENDDLFQDELTYRQRAGSLRMRHAIASWLLALGFGLTDRDFELRRSGADEPLREDYLTFAADVERTLWPKARALAGYSVFRRSSNDLLGSYTIGSFQLGLLHAF